MKIINKVTNETIATILGGENLTLDEAINLVGEIINDTNDDRWSDDGDNVLIDKGIYWNRYWYEDLDYVADSYTADGKRVFKLEDDYREYLVEECTAICASIGETERTEALYVHYYDKSGEHVEYVVFNWDMPEDEDEFLAMCEDSSAWDGWYGTLETIEECDR
jgi:hypothetical protein